MNDTFFRNWDHVELPIQKSDNFDHQPSIKSVTTTCPSKKKQEETLFPVEVNGVFESWSTGSYLFKNRIALSIGFPVKVLPRHWGARVNLRVTPWRRDDGAGGRPRPTGRGHEDHEENLTKGSHGGHGIIRTGRSRPVEWRANSSRAAVRYSARRNGARSGPAA